MKEIVFSKNSENFTFDFYFSHNAQIMMSILGGIMLLVFTLLYLFKPFFKINDETYFLLVIFIAFVVILHLYGKLRWLSARKRLVITPKEVMLYHAAFLVKKFLIDDVENVTVNTESVLIFKLNSVVISTKEDAISIAGFKKGEDIDKVHDKLVEIILRRNQG